MVLGAYFLTYCEHDLQKLSAEQAAKAVGVKGLKRYRTEEEVELAIDDKVVGYQQPIEYPWSGELYVTTPGRVIFNVEVERALDEATGGDFEDHEFLNKTLTKRELDAFIGDLVEHYGPNTIAAALDVIKSVTFRFATRAGITISKNDIVLPGDKEEILAGFEDEVTKVGREYDRGLMTEEERDERIIAIWTRATDEVADRMMDDLEATNPIYMMANSGARGSFNQIRQLAGMRGLMADPKGEIITRPIKANFMEGLTVLEYFISTHGARKGLADTALRTADSGLPDAPARRRLAGRHHPRGRLRHRGVHRGAAHPRRRSEQERRRTRRGGRHHEADQGREAGQDRHHREGRRDHDERPPAARRGVRRVRGDGDDPGPLGAEVPQRVGALPPLLRHVPRDRRHGRDRRRGRHHRRPVDRRAGHPAHDAYVPHGRRRGLRHHARPSARRRDLRGAEPEGCGHARRGRRARWTSRTPSGRSRSRSPRRRSTPNGELPDAARSTASRGGRGCSSARGTLVEPGDALNEGSLNPADLLMLKSATSTELYLVNEVQKVYKSQGVEIHDKHIELIVRQMLKKVRVESERRHGAPARPARRQGRPRARERCA